MSAETTGNTVESTPKEQRSVEELLGDVDDFIRSIYSDGLVSPSTPLSSSRVRRNNRNNIPIQQSPGLNENISSLNNSSSSPESEGQPAVPRSYPFSPENRHNMDAELERINRICVNADRSLNAIGIYVNGRRGDHAEAITNNDDSIIPSSQRNTANGDIVAFVDLSETQVETPEVLRPQRTWIQGDGYDDEVVIVSSNVPPVIDLCTPGYEAPTSGSRPRTIRRSQLSRRVLDQANQPEEAPAQRRRLSPSTSAVTYQEIDTDDNNTKNNTSATNNTPAHNPFKCPVCMDSCLGRRPTSTKCGHVFCEECIKRAIRMTHKCPLCNTKIWDKNLIRIYL